jgi:hypothetical protein
VLSVVRCIKEFHHGVKRSAVLVCGRTINKWFDEKVAQQLLQRHEHIKVVEGDMGPGKRKGCRWRHDYAPDSKEAEKANGRLTRKARPCAGKNAA